MIFTPRGFFKFLDALANASGEAGNFLGPEKEDDDREDQNDLAAAKIKYCNHCIHKWFLTAY